MFKSLSAFSANNNALDNTAGLVEIEYIKPK